MTNSTDRLRSSGSIDARTRRSVGANAAGGKTRAWIGESPAAHSTGTTSDTLSNIAVAMVFTAWLLSIATARECRSAARWDGGRAAGGVDRNRLEYARSAQASTAHHRRPSSAAHRDGAAPRCPATRERVSV